MGSGRFSVHRVEWRNRVSDNWPLSSSNFGMCGAIHLPCHAPTCTKFLQESTNALGFIKAILLHGCHLCISATHVAIFNVMATIIATQWRCLENTSRLKLIHFLIKIRGSNIDECKIFQVKQLLYEAPFWGVMYMEGTNDERWYSLKTAPLGVT